MRKAFKLGAAIAILGLLAASVADARGGGGGGRGGGGRGGGARGGGAAGRAGRAAAGTNARGGKGKNAANADALAELEDRKALILDRRRRLMDSDREANMEARFSAARIDAAARRSGDDIR